MPVQRLTKHYETHEVLASGAFAAIMEVTENEWLLEHSHDFPEMICVLSGKGNQYINGKALPAEACEFYLIPVGSTHVFRPDAHKAGSPGLKVRNVIFRAEWLAEWAGTWMEGETRVIVDWLLGKAAPGSGSRPPWIQIKDTSGEMERRTAAMSGLCRHRPRFFQTRLAAEMLGLLALIGEATDGGTVQQAVWPAVPGTDPLRDTLSRAIAAMRLQTVSAKEVAAQAGVSERHLARLFPKLFGTTFGKYVQERRLAESMKLLRDTDRDIRSIIREVGLLDADHFYRLFRRKTGMTPGQFRRSAQRLSGPAE